MPRRRYLCSVITGSHGVYTGRMDFAGLVTPLTRQTLSGDVYQQLRDLLLYGRAMPGEQLSFRSIAEALGVSVMPVREAVHRLVAEQALELSANRTLRVPVMTVSQFRETATRLDEDTYRAIDALNERFSRELSAKRPDKARLVAFNKELHFAIYRQAGMPVLLQMIESLWLRIGPILNYDLRSGSARVTHREQADHHGRLMNALRKRNASAAAEALRGDIQSAADFIISQGVLVAADVTPDVPPVGAEAAKAAKRLRAALAST
jgi:DNA-binding GntR family transcriptional regulator